LLPWFCVFRATAAAEFYVVVLKTAFWRDRAKAEVLERIVEESGSIAGGIALLP
jgi:hypothetical protein